MSRLFVSAEFDNNIKDHLINEIAPQFGPALIRGKITAKQNMHLTLKFIGERKDDDINDIIDMLHKSHEAIAPFDVKIRGIGAFPNKNNPKIIWARTIENELSLLSKNIENNLVKIGIKKDNKPFSPHITFFRVKEVYNQSDISDVIESLNDIMIGVQHISSFNLMKSTLTPSGPQYTTIEVFTL